MAVSRRPVAALSLFPLFLVTAPLSAQNEPNGLSVGRQMIAEDNPGELWVARGERLFYEKRGPKQGVT